MSDIAQWWTSGEQVNIGLGGVDRSIFVQKMGSGPAMTMLHGFPSSSHDWATVAPMLAQSHSLLLPDLFGFGASEKPAEHSYSLHEQTDLIESLWEREEITSTILVVHDYAVSIAQELLARRAEGALKVQLTQVHLLNGALYPKLAHLEPGQVALLDPQQGPLIGENITEDLFVMGLKPTFAENFDAGADSAEIWRAIAKSNGQTILYLLIRYVNDRAVFGERWTNALQNTDVPLSFIWGMLDPVSGAHMANKVRECVPDAPFLALEDVGHWPALEVPEQLAAALLRS